MPHTNVMSMQAIHVGSIEHFRVCGLLSSVMNCNTYVRAALYDMSIFDMQLQSIFLMFVLDLKVSRQNVEHLTIIMN